MICFTIVVLLKCATKKKEFFTALFAKMRQLWSELGRLNRRNSAFASCVIRLKECYGQFGRTFCFPCTDMYTRVDAITVTMP